MMSASCLIAPIPAHAAAPLPVLGTDAEAIKQYDATVDATGRPLRWNLSFVRYDQSINARLFDDLAQRGVTHIVITIGLNNSLADIASGKLDGNLQKISTQMFSWQQANPRIQLIVRPFHEMNGDWYAWGFKKGHNGNSVSQFIPAWRHVRGVMRSSFPNLAFMWCPGVNQDDKFAAYYPGNDQVEYLAFDGYNHSTSSGGWNTMQQIFHKSMAALRSTRGIDPKKPLVVAEMATTEPDAPSAASRHSKAEWYGDSYGNMGWWLQHEAPKFGVSAILYFDYPDLYTGKKPSPVAYKNDYLIYDPNLPNAPQSRAAFRAAVHDLP
jgi:hypothetical protein